MDLNNQTTQILAETVRALRFEDLPTDTVWTGKQCILDATGCALAGASEPLVEILVRNVVHPEGSTSARLLGRVEYASPLTAALVNGSATHALDYDDTHLRMFGHASAPVLPALLSLAETESLSGKQFLTSFIVGVEVQTRLGALLNPKHYSAGFHATGTLGSFGAAAACAHALELTEDQFCHALGLAGTQAAGLKASFGSMAKPLHAGKAAQAGLLSALLARDGFTGHPAIIETEQGFAAAYQGTSTSPKNLRRFDNRFLIRDTLFKYHAACYLTHAAIEATMQLVSEGLDPLDIESVEVLVAPEILDICAISEPKTGLEGKFSVRGTVAMALLKIDTGALTSYSDEQMKEPRYIAVRDKVTLTPRENLTTTQTTVIVSSEGRRMEITHDSSIPEKRLDKQWERLSHKFRVLTTPVIGSRSVEILHRTIDRLEELESASELLEHGRPTFG